MKLYTDETQTAKLIEFGFEKPKGLADAEPSSGKWVREAYSIGELIEMLPEFSNIYDLMNLHTMKRRWYVCHISTLNVSADELIDALYNMIVKLKEEGAI